MKRETSLSIFKRIRTLSTVAVFTVLLAGFQNCGNLSSNGFAPKESKVSSYVDKHDASFFAYPFTSAPELYADLQSVRLADTGSFRNLKIIGAAALANGAQAAVHYIVEVKNRAGVALCPQHSGTLNPSFTTISYTCVTAQDPAEARVTMSLSFGSGTLTVERPL